MGPERNGPGSGPALPQAEVAVGGHLPPGPRMTVTPKGCCGEKAR